MTLYETAIPTHRLGRFGLVYEIDAKEMKKLKLIIMAINAVIEM